MNALDTNVLVRFLVQDDDQQSQIVNTLFAAAEAHKQPLFVSSIVVLELMWVLKSAYDVPRAVILDALNELLSLTVLEFQDQLAIRDFVVSAQDNNYDLSDLLIGQIGLYSGCKTTLTFDKKAAKSPQFTNIKGSENYSLER